MIVVWDLFKKNKKKFSENAFVEPPKKKVKLKILNLYCGVGGNRRYWKNCEVTAVEYDPEIAKIYKYFFPDDKVVVGDAHAYLLKNFKKFDFIWASPPCPSHSRFRFNMWRSGQTYKDGKVCGPAPVYPSMILYEEILLLAEHFKGKYVVENTQSYYKPLLQPQIVSRHYIWANFKIPNIKIDSIGICSHDIEHREKELGFKLPSYITSPGRQEKLLNNCAHPKMGLHILNCALHSLGG